MTPLPTTPLPTTPPARPGPQHPGPDGTASAGAGLGAVLAAGAVRSAYQPIVDLDTGAVVAFEALARGPAGSDLESPDRLFGAARACGRLAELDRACVAAALAGARAAGLAAPWTLFVNTEPEVAGAPPVRSVDRLPVVVELTERALTARPAELLQLVARVRARGWGVALDDVGADRASLALLPLLRPDVIKLDLRLVQQRPTGAVAEIVAAVGAEAERSGALVLAEGVETPAHRDVARALGARLGQGWLFGRPGPLPAGLPAPSTPIGVTARPAPSGLVSPYEIVAARRAPRAALKPLLIEVSKHLERQVARSGETAVVLSAFQDATFFTPATRLRYADLVAGAAFVGALGEGMPAEPAPGVRGGVLAPDDPLVHEWDIAVVSPHFAATLVARDLGDQGPDRERRFAFVLTHDRDLAPAVAAELMARIEPEPGAA